MAKYKVENNQRLTQTSQLLTLICDDSHPILFEPGQYAGISMRDRLRPTAMRCFSISSSPTNQQRLQFSIRINGIFTHAVERLNTGDKVRVKGPFGGFVFNPSDHEDVVLLAGGIGVAPFMSMIRYANDIKLKNSVHLVFSSRNQDDIPFFEDIEAIQKENDNFKATYIIGHGETEKIGTNVLKGYLDAENLEKLQLDFENQIFFVCGPPSYMKAVIKQLKKHGVSDSRILSEAFSQGSHRQTGKIKSWPFNVYSLSGMLFMVAIFSISLFDLYETIPKLEAQQRNVSTESTNVIGRDGYPLDQAVNTRKPQVDTKLDQDPRVNTTTSTNTAPSNSGFNNNQQSQVISPTQSQTTSTPRTTVS